MVSDMRLHCKRCGKNIYELNGDSRRQKCPDCGHKMIVEKVSLPRVARKPRMHSSYSLWLDRMNKEKLRDKIHREREITNG